MSDTTIFDFTPMTLDNKTILLHANIRDDYSFYKALFDFFFDENRLLSYIENKTGLQFSPTRQNYVALFQQLKYYIDDCNQSYSLNDLSDEVKRILSDEYGLEDGGDGHLRVKSDKMGKIGEYMCSIILAEYFNFSCIIPKVKLTTDYNMSVYGIDVLYYSEKNDMILLGESKLSKSLENGRGLINESLETYEKQIKDEFTLIFNNRLLKPSMGIFGEKYGNYVEISLTVEDFIKEANIKRIGIPLFIAHGTQTDPQKIFKMLSQVKHPDLLNLEVVYYIISLPIVKKDKLIGVFTQAVLERMQQYEKAVRNQSSES